jgi:hypothetical protein
MFRAAGGVADGDRQAGFGRQRGEFDLPQPYPVAVGPAVGADQQPAGARVERAAHRLPPAAQGGDGEGGGVVVTANRHPAALAATS